MSSALDLQEINTIGDLEAIERDWVALWTSAGAVTPFQSPEWLLTWCRHLGHGELAVLALRRSGRLVGLAPWMIYHDPHADHRTLIFLGTGISDYLDVLSAPGFEAAGVEASLGWLDRNSDRWDSCDLRQLPPFSPLAKWVAVAAVTGETACDEPCPVLKLLPGHAAIPPHQLANLRYYRSRAERIGEIEIQRATHSNLPSLIEHLFLLHQARWDLRGNPGVLAEPAIQLFHRAVIPKLLEAGVLRLYALRIADRVAAVFYGFQHRGRAYYYLGGFDPEFQSCSPGTLMIGHAIDQASAESASEFDFLRGREKYKYLWGASDRPTYRCILTAHPSFVLPRVAGEERRGVR